MTKIAKVISFIEKNENFTWKKFSSSLKASYPSTEHNYLALLVKAGYVNKVGRGKYNVFILPSGGFTYKKLVEDSKNPPMYSKPFEPGDDMNRMPEPSLPVPKKFWNEDVTFEEKKRSLLFHVVNLTLKIMAVLAVMGAAAYLLENR